MMTNNSTNSTLEDVAALVRTVAYGPEASRLVVRLARLLADGRPVTDAQVTGIIDELGLDRDQALGHLAAYAEHDNNGDIIGVPPGITLRQTPHQFTTDTAQLWAWCALDTLVLPPVLGQRARVATTSPASKQTIRYTASPNGISDIGPAGVVVSFPGLLPGANPTDPRRLVLNPAQATSVEHKWEAYCHHSFVFGSVAEARAWFADRDDIVVVPLSEAFDVIRAVADKSAGP